MKSELPTTVVGVVRAGTIRYPLARQVAACRDAGAETVFEINARMSLEDIAKDWTAGTRIVVHWLWLMAPHRAKVANKRRAVIRFLDGVTAGGAELYEAGSGRSSLDRDQRADMLADAMHSIATWRPAPTGRGMGRPPKAEKLNEQAYEIWADPETYPRYVDCERAWGRRWGTWQKALRLWGPRRKFVKEER